MNRVEFCTETIPQVCEWSDPDNAKVIIDELKEHVSAQFMEDDIEAEELKISMPSMERMKLEFATFKNNGDILAGTAVELKMKEFLKLMKIYDKHIMIMEHNIGLGVEMMSMHLPYEQDKSRIELHRELEQMVEKQLEGEIRLLYGIRELTVVMMECIRQKRGAE